MIPQPAYLTESRLLYDSLEQLSLLVELLEKRVGEKIRLLTTECSLTLVRGLPGSGKSTRAAAIAAACDGIVIDIDQYFIGPDGKYYFDVSRIVEAHAWCQQCTRVLLEQRAVIVANTFTMPWEMQPYEKIAKSLSVSLEVIDLFDGSLSDAELAARNVHGVPLKTIAAMRARYVR